MEVQGKVAIITGASMGIGAATARVFAEAGAKLVLAARSEDKTINLDLYRQIIELNLFGPLHTMQAVVPKMQAQGGGVIINISSNVSKMAIPGIGAYASTKYALNGLSLTARNELAADNIRVVLFHPGRTSTDFGKNALVEENMRNWRPGGNQSMPEPDSAEAVAHKILEAAITEPAEMGMPMQGQANG